MKYLNDKFSVFPGGNDNYRNNYDQIDWSDKGDTQEEKDLDLIIKEEEKPSE